MSTNEGHAVYNTTLERFVTGVHPTKAKAEAAAGKAPEGQEFQTRHVTEKNPTGAPAATSSDSSSSSAS